MDGYVIFESNSNIATVLIRFLVTSLPKAYFSWLLKLVELVAPHVCKAMQQCADFVRGQTGNILYFFFLMSANPSNKLILPTSLYCLNSQSFPKIYVF